MAAEFILVFFALPALFAVVHVPGGPIPELLVLTVAVPFCMGRFLYHGTHFAS
jgi:hypothetical protein